MHIFVQMLIVLVLFSCGNPDSAEDKEHFPATKKEAYHPSDYPFPTLEVKGKIWMAQNLSVDHYRDGSLIPEARTAQEWDSCFQKQIGCWCYYNNDTALGKQYGRMYNCYAIGALFELAPAGWHVAHEEDWNELEQALGGRDEAAGPLKTTGTIKDKTGLWEGENKGATNQTGFSALPGGWRDENAKDRDMGYYAFYWTSLGKLRELFFSHTAIQSQSIGFNNYGFYVRCVKD